MYACVCVHVGCLTCVLSCPVHPVVLSSKLPNTGLAVDYGLHTTAISVCTPADDTRPPDAAAAAAALTQRCWRQLCLTRQPWKRCCHGHLLAGLGSRRRLAVWRPSWPHLMPAISQGRSFMWTGDAWRCEWSLVAGWEGLVGWLVYLSPPGCCLC